MAIILCSILSTSIAIECSSDEDEDLLRNLSELRTKKIEQDFIAERSPIKDSDCVIQMTTYESSGYVVLLPLFPFKILFCNIVVLLIRI